MTDVTRLSVEILIDAMNDAYLYEDPDNGVPELPFIDDNEAFWRPFAKKVWHELAEHHFVVPDEARPTLCAAIVFGERCALPRGNSIHV